MSISQFHFRSSLLYWELTFFTRIFAPVGFLPIVKVLGKEPSGPEVRLYFEPKEQWCLNDFLQAVIETLSNPFPAWQFSLPKN